MINLLVLFILKILDCAFSTVKNICLFKKKYFLSAVVNSIAQFFYFIMIVMLTKQNTMSSKIIATIAVFLGSYYSALILEKREADKLFVYDITSSSIEDGISFADKIREKNIPIKTYITYDKYLQKVLSCKVYSENKEQSRLIKKIMPKDFKYIVLYNN